MESIACPKCISIRQNCKMKTTCKKCKDANKIARKEVEHKNDVELLKQKVKTNPKELLNVYGCWSKDAIITALSLDYSIVDEVEKIYPETRCYSVHTEEIRSLIFSEIEKAKKRQEEVYAIKRISLIEELVKLANYNINNYSIYQNEKIYNNKIMRLENWIEAVKKHPGIIQFIPRYYRTYELCLAAMYTEDMDIIAKYNNNSYNLPLRHVPDEHKSMELCLVAISWCKYAIKLLPERHMCYNMYLRAAAVNPTVVSYEFMPGFWDNDEIRQAAGLEIVEPINPFEFNKPKQIKLSVYIPNQCDINSSLDCPICLEDFTINEVDVYQVDCKHIFHKNCIKEWNKLNDICPKCRKKIC